MTTAKSPSGERYRALTERNIEDSEFWQWLPQTSREALRVVSKVLPFRTNAYVARELIDWNRVPDDPIFQLTFPQPGMLDPVDYRVIADLLRQPNHQAGLNPKASVAFDTEVARIRASLNPHPGGQMTDNVPHVEGQPVPGLQHKYRETVLFFPSQGQTCHAYCTYCFRWSQFIGEPTLRFASREIDDLVGYIRAHPNITDVLITGGDPLIMKTSILRRYIEPLLAEDLPQLRHIRLGTKALAYWPQRLVTDPDADDLLRLFEEVAASGRHLALMAHYSHPREFAPTMARRAIARARSAGAEIRLQAPVVRHVNDSADVWAELWRQAVTLGIIPYYFFVERDTGPRRYFELPLTQAYAIFRAAQAQVSGLARSARGPCMSAFPGKVRILGDSHVGSQRCLVLDYIQARDPTLVGRPFFAHYDPHATWFDDLRPFSEHDYRFFAALSEAELNRPIGATL